MDLHERRKYRPELISLLLFAVLISACGGTSTGGIFAVDETQDAAKLVQQANVELTKIKVLYTKNEDKRTELKSAMTDQDAAQVQKIANDVAIAINEGAVSIDDAIGLLEKAQEMKTNDDYKEYLRLKVETLRKQKEAFAEYRKAARSLSEKYSPQNEKLREEVTAEFKERSAAYGKLMEDARNFSSEANELAKDVFKRERAK